MNMRHRRVLAALATAVALAAPLVVAGTPASAAPKPETTTAARPGHNLTTGRGSTPSLPAPPPPPTGLPKQPSGYQPPTALLQPSKPGTTTATPSAGRTAAPTAVAASTASQAVTWGAAGPATTLVVYDTTNSYGWLGELYAMAAGNLASHFGTVTAEPATSYASGQVNNYTSTVYIGSTYNEPIPAAFINDVLTTTHPVTWAADNIWQLSGTDGSSADQAFEAKYGWDPSTSYFDTADNPTTVAYKGQTFSRNAANGANVLAPHIVTPTAVSVLGRANCSDASGAPVNCAPIAQTTGTSFPWAIRSANLTYVGEVPFSYLSESNRYVIFSDLLFAALAPTAKPSHQALVRLEDVNPTSSPTALWQFADYLSKQKVPFSIGVIPEYTDPTGYYNGGTAETITLAQAPDVVAALKYVQSKGGTIIRVRLFWSDGRSLI